MIRLLQARLKKREKVPFFLSSSSWAKSTVLGDAFAQRIWPLAGPLRRSFRAEPRQENSRRPKRVVWFVVTSFSKHNSHLRPGGPAPRTPPRARSRDPSFFFTMKSGGVHRIIPTQFPFLLPGLGLKLGSFEKIWREREWNRVPVKTAP